MESHYSLLKMTITYTRESTLILSLMATALNVAKNIMLSKVGQKRRHPVYIMTLRSIKVHPTDGIVGVEGGKNYSAQEI